MTLSVLLPRCGVGGRHDRRAELLEEAEQVAVDPQLDDLTVPDPGRPHAGEFDRPSGGGEGAEGAVLRALDAGANRRPVALRQHVLDGHGQVGEGGAELRHRLLVPVAGGGMAEGRVVVDEVGRQDGVGGGEVGLAPDLLGDPSEQRLVVLERHGNPFHSDGAPSNSLMSARRARAARSPLLVNSSTWVKSKVDSDGSSGRIMTSTRGIWALIISRSMELRIPAMSWRRWGGRFEPAGRRVVSWPATFEPMTKRVPAVRSTRAGMGVATPPAMRARARSGQGRGARGP